MKALVTGGTGTLGRTLVKRLLADGWHVKILSRNNEMPGFRCRGKLTHVRGDITDRQKVIDCVKDVAAVFHLAARLGTSKGQYREFERVNVDGTRWLVEGCRNSDVKKLVFASSIAVYGKQSLQSGADESTPVHPDSFYSLSKARAEDLVIKAENTSKEKIGVVLRVASVYGPKKKNYSLLIKSIRAGFVFLFKNGVHKRTLVHDRDFAEAAVCAALNPKSSNCVYNVTDGNVYTMKEIVNAIAGAMRRKFIFLVLPLPLEKHVLKLLRILSINGVIDKLFDDKVARGCKIQEELHFKPLYSLERGWADAVRRCLNKENFGI